MFLFRNLKKKQMGNQATSKEIATSVGTKEGKTRKSMLGWKDQNKSDNQVEEINQNILEKKERLKRYRNR